MAKNSYIDSGEFVESGKWNAAKDYTTLMIFKPLLDCQEYEVIARFGTAEIDQELTIPLEMQTKYRLLAIKRILFKLQQVINNAEFALKKKDRVPVLKFRDRLDFIEKSLISKVEIKRRNRDKINTAIDESKFDFLLKELQEIRRKISDFFDNADLIYFSREQTMTQDQLDKAIWDEATKQG
mgnify:CR=1 FL=1